MDINGLKNINTIACELAARGVESAEEWRNSGMDDLDIRASLVTLAFQTAALIIASTVMDADDPSPLIDDLSGKFNKGFRDQIADICGDMRRTQTQ